MRRLKPLRAHDFEPPAEKKPRDRARVNRPAVIRRITESVLRRQATDAEALRVSGIRLKDPARPTHKELQRARAAVARLEKFAGLFFTSEKGNGRP
jgi:hypothetical protein